MKRKVIQIADKTLVVSLPNSWAKQWGVIKGAEVDVVESGPRLVVSSGESRVLKKGNVDVSTASERSLRWLLSSLHKKGYDEIEVVSDNPLHAVLVDELLKDLFLGFAVVHRSGSQCIIRSLSKDLDDQLDVIVRRAFLVSLSMADQCLDFVKKKDFIGLRGLIDLEKTNNQLTNFCERILNKRGLDEPVKTNFLYVIVWNLEKIADEYKYICEFLSVRKKINPDTIKFLEETNLLFRRFYELFYKFNVSGLSVLSDDFKSLRNRIEQALDKGGDGVLLSYLLHVVMKCADFSSSTFALND